MDMTLEEYERFLNRLSALVVEFERHGVSLKEIVISECVSFNGRASPMIAGVIIRSESELYGEEENGEQ